jgi:GNAT superfamily N-acetyltransferase
MNLSFKELEPSNPDLIEVMLPSIGNPEAGKIKQILKSYNLKNHYIIGGFLDNKLVGIIGNEINNNSAIIKHLSVLSEFRNQSIGSKLIQYISNYFSLKIIKTETDEDAIMFYQTLGFKCESFNGEYGVRYQCYLENIAI